MGVTITGDKELDRWFRRQPKDLPQTIASGMRLTSEDIRNEWVRFIRSMGAIDTGTYRDSITVDPMSLLTHEIFTAVEYSVHVELGTSRMPARPAMTAAATLMESRLLDRFIEVIKRKYT
jgi:hypothetical protein